MSGESFLIKSDLLDEHKGFVATKPVEQLQAVEALALLNRWVKLKDYFYYDDRDALQALKNRQIAEFVRAGEMQATAVIVRESEAIQGILILDGKSSLMSKENIRLKNYYKFWRCIIER